MRRHEGKEAAFLDSTEIEAPLPYKDKIFGITADNAKAFTRHKEITKGTDAEFNFTIPHRSWEWGANDNTNGLIRQFIPMGTDFIELTDEIFAEIEWKLNHRPINHSVTSHLWSISKRFITLTLEAVALPIRIQRI